MKAPVFSLQNQDGKTSSLTDYLGKWVVVYFYPKDDTPGCTKEACGFRDVYKEFMNRNIVVLGISKDTNDSHQKFAKKYRLPFPLLADPEHKVIEAYGAWGRKKFMGREFFGTLRRTYLVDPKGEIVKTYTQVSPFTHANQILKDFDSLTG
ncbi:thioredoxin-dependent thiol peroxidase [Candidatus Gottesmanbacteria bacterium]|nr:thioredoxin-dependent thiol peroxidase [Candidatus Gottesmanbacteria bacterium]